MREPNQDRAPPAFQEYAATILASIYFRLMTLLERGLTWSMKLEAWHNGGVPADPAKLCRVLGCTQSEIEAGLTPNVMAFFRVEGDQIVCPELDAYKAKLLERRERQSEGGKSSAAKINSRRKSSARRANASDQAKPTANSLVSSEQADSFLVKTSTAKNNQTQLTNGADKNPWVDDFEKTERAAKINADGEKSGK